MAASSGLLVAWLLRTTHLSFPPCLFKSVTGLPCATCGMTRCFSALSQGDWRAAFHWHPVGMLLLLASPMGAVWDLRRAWSGRPFPDLPDSLAARVAVVGLFLGAWALQVARGV